MAQHSGPSGEAAAVAASAVRSCGGAGRFGTGGQPQLQISTGQALTHGAQTARHAQPTRQLPSRLQRRSFRRYANTALTAPMPVRLPTSTSPIMGSLSSRNSRDSPPRIDVGLDTPPSAVGRADKGEATVAPAQGWRRATRALLSDATAHRRPCSAAGPAEGGPRGPARQPHIARRGHTRVRHNCRIAEFGLRAAFVILKQVADQPRLLLAARHSLQVAGLPEGGARQRLPGVRLPPHVNAGVVRRHGPARARLRKCECARSRRAAWHVKARL